MTDEKFPKRIDDNLEGTVVFNLPFPAGEDLSSLKQMAPLVIKQPYAIEYNYSYGQDSPFFAALTNGRFIACREPQSGYTYATPRGHDMYSGNETAWVEITPEGKIHAFTVCHFGSEAFLPECPFVLIQVEFEACDTLFLGRLIGVDPQAASIDWIGRPVKGRFLRNAKLKPTDIYFNLLEK
ncbi:MAG: OB-fold domain-containing protein [Anaerolineales bacterium]|nr:OB-fold domain-containing protein [Anaerolineales bacterium]